MTNAVAKETAWDAKVREIGGKMVQDCIDREGEETAEQVQAFAETRVNAQITDVRIMARDEFVQDVVEYVSKNKAYIADQVKARQAERAKQAKK